MPPVEQTVGDDWITTSYDLLCIGDAITATIAVMRAGPDGQPLRKVNEKTGRPYYPKDRIAIRGRIVGLDYTKPDALVIERTKYSVAVPRHALLPEFVVTLSAADLSTDFVQLWRNVRSGPKVRTQEAGEAYLLDLLRRAAGGDEKDKAAIERVAACVHPNARLEDPVYDLGIRRATSMLRGDETFSESVYRQLKGWESIPKAEMTPTKVPRTAPRRSAPKETDEQRGERLRILTEHPDGDQILAIMNSMPGVSIREVRLLSDPKAEARRRELAGGDPNSTPVSTTPFIDAPSEDVTPPIGGTEEDIVYHDDEESDDSGPVSPDPVIDR